MDGPRQPPDGHEFPDQEKPIEHKTSVVEKVAEKPHPVAKPREPWLSKYEPQVNSVRDKIAIFSKPQTSLNKKYVSTSSIPVESSSFVKSEYKPTLVRNNSINDSTPSSTKYRTTANITPQYKNVDYVIIGEKTNLPSGLHGRSVSLSDINDTSHNKFDRWNLLIEQRSLSKLKGLVIPEHEPETDTTSQLLVDLPEIQSIPPPVIMRTKPTEEIPARRRNSSSVPNFVVQSTEPLSPSLPKYSPAFKRRSFQIHSSNVNHTVPKTTQNHQFKNDKFDLSKVPPPPPPPPSVKTHDFSNLNLNIVSTDPPKSLESITSPTRSDYSFDYNNVIHQKTDQKHNKILTARPNSYTSDPIGSSEYESDTDSALSSSQSSYLSKTSPPASPIHIRIDSELQKKNTISQYSEIASNYDSLNRRLLKPQSVEAINRKNILASAKCRSGKDIKVGSPLIQRKFEEEPSATSKLSNGKPETKPVAAERKVSSEKVDDKKATIQEEQVPRKIENKIAPRVLQRNFKGILNERPTEVRRNFDSTSHSNYSVVRRASSVTDLRKNFEKIAPTPAKRNSINTLLNYNTPSVKPQPIKRTSLPHIIPLNDSIKKDEYKSTKIEISKEMSTNSSTYDEIIENAIKEFDMNIFKEDVKVVKVKPDVDGGSIGITLAGGADYETKEITIHKIREGSPAYRDGRLQKGDKILAINGKCVKGFSHAQSLKALKENVPEVVIVACCNIDSVTTPTSPNVYSRQISLESEKISSTPGPGADNFTLPTSSEGNIFEVSIMKDATGLGFSIQGGKSSPQGDMPLIIKKIFMGGAAEKVINLKAGDELLEINHINVTTMSRMEAWNLMKKLPENQVIIKVRR